MIGYKIAVGFDRETGPSPVVVTLEIPEDAKVVRPKDGILCNTRYCVSRDYDPRWIRQLRTNKAKTIRIDFLYVDTKTKQNWNNKAYSIYNITKTWDFSCSAVFYYMKDREVCSELDEDDSRCCTHGIHFFETQEDAIRYLFFESGCYMSNLLKRMKYAWNCKQKDGELLYDPYIDMFKKYLFLLSE